MATFQFLSEAEYDETHHIYSLEVTSDLGDDDIRVHVQDVLFKPTEADEKAQEYADQMEKELKEQKEAEEEQAAREAEEEAARNAAEQE